MAPQSPTPLALRGNVPAIATPFAPNGDLMLDAFADLVDWLIASGADGICVAGDNGEAWALKPEERRALAETAVRRAAGRVPVILGASATSNRQAIAYAEIAAAAGCAGILVQPQSYVLKATTAELVARFEALGRAVPLPIVVYNSPRRSGGINIEPAQLAAICEVAPIAGLKESSRDFFHVTHILERFADRIAVMMGPCPFILPGLALGAAGFIATGPELLGAGSRRIMALGTAAPTAEARRLHYRLTVIYETLMATGTWPSALKAALNLLGQPAGVPREPVQPLTPEATAKLRQVMTELELL